MYELQVQGDRIRGAFFRMKGGVTKGRKEEGKGGKVCRPVTGVLRGGHPGMMGVGFWVLGVRC